MVEMRPPTLPSGRAEYAGASGAACACQYSASPVNRNAKSAIRTTSIGCKYSGCSSRRLLRITPFRLPWSMTAQPRVARKKDACLRETAPSWSASPSDRPTTISAMLSFSGCFFQTVPSCQLVE